MVDFDNPDAVLVDRKVAESTVSGDTDSFTEEWLFRGGSFLDIHALARTYKGSFHPESDIYKLKSISLSPFGEINGRVQAVAQVSYSRSEVNIIYGGKTDQEPTISFSCGGGTKHINTGPLIKSNAAPGEGAPPNPGQFIGWNGSMDPANFNVAGVDVPTASLKESWTAYMRMGELSTKWKRRIAQMIGTVNEKTFKGWEKGECLFIDCSFSGVDDSREVIQVKFDFAIKLNEEDAEVVGVKLGKVEGWQYCWSIAKPNIPGYHPVAAGVYVSQVVNYSDLNKLGI